MQEGDVCRMRLTIPPFKVRPYYSRDPYLSQSWMQKWSKTLEKLCKEGLILHFNAQLHQDRYYRVDDKWDFCMPDVFYVHAAGVQYCHDRICGYDTLFPEELIGQLPNGTKFECNFFPEAQRACIAWIMCAQRLKIQKDMIQVIGKMILASWNVDKIWYEIFISSPLH